MRSSYSCRPRAAALGFLLTAGAAVQAAPPGDWPMYAHDLAGTRFSALREIDRNNVGSLTEAWTVPVARPPGGGDDAPGAAGNPQATPIVVDGVMYLPVRGHQVLALEADTGRELWRTTLPAPLDSTARGVAY